MNIGVLGAGTWGMALTRMLYNMGHGVTVWSAIGEEIDQLDRERIQKNLPGMVIPAGVKFTKDIGTVCAGRDLLLFAVPSVFVRSTARLAAPYIPEGQLIADVAKGLEPGTLKTMSEIIRDELPGKSARIVALSGPTHAEEVAQDLPTTIVSACADIEAAEAVQGIFMNDVMRVYTNTDIKGVELCGALKNIIALAAGISAGIGFGDNAKAALITRGLAEIARLGDKLGCHHQTFAGLAGMGDLIVTATSRHSRNNRCGFLIGQGVPPEEAIRQVGMVVEGIHALEATMTLSEKYNVEMPISHAVDRVIHHGADPAAEVRRLMNRDPKTELFYS